MFLRYRFGGVIRRGAYFRNFTVCSQIPARLVLPVMSNSGKWKGL